MISIQVKVRTEVAGHYFEQALGIIVQHVYILVNLYCRGASYIPPNSSTSLLLVALHSGVYFPVAQQERFSRSDLA